MRVSTIDFFARAASDFTKQEAMLSNIQAQISLGKRILTPADDPIGAMQSLNLHNEISQFDQFLNNCDTAQSDLEYEDSILDAVSNAYQRIRELTVRAGNASLTNTDRNAIAVEMDERLQELIGLGNTRLSNGDFLFSGYREKTQPISQNPNGTYVFQGDNGQRSVMLGESSLVSASDSGKEIFFNIPSNNPMGTSNNGLASFTTSAHALVNAGSLQTLNVNDLTINHIAIPATLSDHVSSTDSSASALAIANAINSQFNQHGVRAIANANSVDLGTYTPNTLSVNQLEINGIDIIDTIGTESSLIAAISAVSSQTGVTVSQPGGPGTHIVLNATDGRNVQLQTNGVATATFSNFDLTSGPLNQVMQSTVSLRSHQSYSIGGAFPGHVGLTAGTTALSLNSGTGQVSSPTIIGNIPDTTQTYSIVFGLGGASYSIYSDASPMQPIPGFANQSYSTGQNIEFNGIRVAISGTPNANDVFGITLGTQATQDVFTSISNIINQIKNVSDYSELSYDIGVALNNLGSAESSLLDTRAAIGARLNIVDSQRNYQQTLRVLTEQTLSKIEDLNYSEAITQLSQYTFTLEAAQQSFVKIQSLSIFNFLR